MSETLAPLNPEVEVEPVATELEAASPVEEAPQEVDAPEAPDFSKLLQREQQERANMKREFTRQLDSIHDAIKALGTAKPETRQSKLDSIQQKLKGVEGQTMDPQMASMIADLVDEVAAMKSDTGKLSEIEKRQQARDAYETFMEDKPAGFREAYNKRQRELMEEVRNDGLEDADERALGIAMMQWTKGWLKDHTKTAQASVKTPGVKPVVPAGGVRKTVAVEKPEPNPFGWTVK